MTYSTTVDYDVAMEVASHEAIIRQTYKDSVGKLTWSVGMTNATGHTVERYISKPAPLFQCLSIYVWALKNYSSAVLRAFKGYPLTKEQFAAAMSFHWNTGAIERASWVGLVKAGKMKEARGAFLTWNKPPEIISRRKKEAALFFDGIWSNTGTMTEYTRVNSNMTPVWSSAKKIDVSKELRTAFGAQMGVRPDVPMQPEAPVVVPTLSPVPITPNNATSPLVVTIGAAILAVVGFFVYMFLKG